jgi:plasmid maintenance system antidote protein VapI
MIDNKNMWFFHWDSQKCSLTLHNKTKEEALKIAQYFGWSPQVWYKPKTWGNYYTFRQVEKRN